MPLSGLVLAVVTFCFLFARSGGRLFSDDAGRLDPRKIPGKGIALPLVFGSGFFTRGFHGTHLPCRVLQSTAANGRPKRIPHAKPRFTLTSGPREFVRLGGCSTQPSSVSNVLGSVCRSSSAVYPENGLRCDLGHDAMASIESAIGDAIALALQATGYQVASSRDRE